MILERCCDKRKALRISGFGSAEAESSTAGGVKTYSIDDDSGEY